MTAHPLWSHSSCASGSRAGWRSVLQTHPAPLGKCSLHGIREATVDLSVFAHWLLSVAAGKKFFEHQVRQLNWWIKNAATLQGWKHRIDFPLYPFLGCVQQRYEILKSVFHQVSKILNGGSFLSWKKMTIFRNCRGQMLISIEFFKSD